MSLITCCPACATLFKVVPDQLKVAQGWVRCGHCGKVFDASQQLVLGEAAVPGASSPMPGANTPPGTAVLAQDELQARLPSSQPHDDLTQPPPPAWAGAHFLAPTSPDAATDATDATDVAALKADPEAIQTEAETFQPAALPVDAPPAEAPAVPTQPGEEPAVDAVSERRTRIEPVFITDAYSFKAPSLADIQVTDSPTAEPEEEPELVKEPEAAPEVSFVRDAQRKAFWKTPQVRALLGLLFLLMLVALALQWIVREKDVLAAQEPRLAPLLQAICRPLGCEIRPLRRIESLVIDSSNFSKTSPDAYRLTFIFKNTGAAVVEIPALEVTLTDSHDQALVRRVVMPAQFGATAITLGGHSELAGAVDLKISSEGAQAPDASTPTEPLPVAGYRILAFYP